MAGVWLFLLGISLSNTDLILLANLFSAGDSVDGADLFGVIRYTCRKSCRAFLVGVPIAFFMLFLVYQQISRPGRLIVGGKKGFLYVQLGMLNRNVQTP